MPDLVVNGEQYDVEVPVGTSLAQLLREHLGFTGTKIACNEGHCGACTVQVDGEAIRSCVTAVGDVVDQKITTLEGLGSAEKPGPVQAAFIANQAAQCGYCTNGMVMSSAALLARNPKPTREQAQAALAGNLCRCGSHDRVLKAIARASGQGEA